MKEHVCAIAAALCLIPSIASAAWWDYFDRLSGPGPFRAKAVYWTEFRLASVHKGGPNVEEAVASDDADALTWFVTLRYVSLSNEAEIGQVPLRLTPADFALMYRLAPVVDVGAGVSILTFSGTGFDTFSRGALLLPKVTVTPLGFIRPASARARALLRSFKVYGDLTWAGTFSAGDFNNAVPPFPGDEKVLKRAGCLIDFQAVGYAIFHRP